MVKYNIDVLFCVQTSVLLTFLQLI